MTKRISGERKIAYYLGAALMVVGGITFLSVFVTAAMNFGNFGNFVTDARSSMLRAIIGMILLAVGSFVRRIGARGMAGSGVVLDPEKARSELEPYTRMAGGMVKDALDEADIELHPGKPEKIIMVKCRKCGKLNEEDSKFCQECGEPI